MISAQKGEHLKVSGERVRKVEEGKKFWFSKTYCTIKNVADRMNKDESISVCSIFIQTWKNENILPGSKVRHAYRNV